MRLLKKKRRIFPAGSLGMSPSFEQSPKIGGFRGLIETITVVYKSLAVEKSEKVD